MVQPIDLIVVACASIRCCTGLVAIVGYGREVRSVTESFASQLEQTDVFVEL